MTTSLLSPLLPASSHAQKRMLFNNFVTLRRFFIACPHDDVMYFKTCTSSVKQSVTFVCCCVLLYVGFVPRILDKANTNTNLISLIQLWVYQQHIAISIE